MDGNALYVGTGTPLNIRGVGTVVRRGRRKALTVGELKKALGELPESASVDDLPIVITRGGLVVTAVEIVYQVEFTDRLDEEHKPIAVMLRVVET